MGIAGRGAEYLWMRHRDLECNVGGPAIIYEPRRIVAVHRAKSESGHNDRRHAAALEGLLQLVFVRNELHWLS